MAFVQQRPLKLQVKNINLTPISVFRAYQEKDSFTYYNREIKLP